MPDANCGHRSAWALAHAMVLSAFLSSGPAAALEPLAGPRNWPGVCAQLARVPETAETMIAAAEAGEDAFPAFQAYKSALMSLGFSAATRATVDADHLDAMLTAAEYVALIPISPVPPQQGVALRDKLRDFAGKYRCRVVERDNEEARP